MRVPKQGDWGRGFITGASAVWTGVILSWIVRLILE